jgi:hypothetical protein
MRYIKIIEKWGRDGSTTFDCHWKSMESRVGTNVFNAAIKRLLFFEVYKSTYFLITDHNEQAQD